MIGCKYITGLVSKVETWKSMVELFDWARIEVDGMKI